MKLRYGALFVCLAVFGGAAFSETPSAIGNRWDGQKDWTPTNHPVEGPGVGGDDTGSATVVDGLPYVDTGNTCAAADDYDEPCPWGGSAPDVVYAFTPAVDMFITIDLCESSYDTKVFVYENTAGNLVACNDDGCDGPNYPNPWLSYLECVPLSAGETYYIVVDGYSQDCGDYVLRVEECVPPQPCDVACPGEGVDENEPVCGVGYVDAFNGGCNSTPVAFSEIVCNVDPVVLCGESGTWYDGVSYWRDTDWWTFTLTEMRTVRLATCADFTVQTLLIIPDPDCGNYTYPYLVTADPNVEAVIEATLTPGTYWYWVGPQSYFDTVPCGSPYVTTITGLCPPSRTESSTWGSVKGIFR